MEIAWQYSCETRDAGPFRGIPGYDREKVYFSSGSHLYVLDALTGEELWHYDAEGYISQSQVNDEFAALLAQTGWVNETLIVLNADTGELMWEQEGHFRSFSFGSSQLFAALEGHIRAYDLITGEQLWDNQEAATSHWPLYLLYESESNSLYAEAETLRVLNADTGEIIREFGIQTAPRQTSIYRDILYTADEDAGMLTAIDGQTGNVIWSKKYRPAGDYFNAPTLVDGVLYFPDKKGNLLAVDSANGEILWQYSPTEVVYVPSNITVFNGGVYAVFSDNTLRGIDAQTGQEIGRIQAEGVNPPGGNTNTIGIAKTASAGDLLLVTFDGITLFALQPQ